MIVIGGLYRRVHLDPNANQYRDRIVENFNPEFKVAIFIFGKKNITNISYAKGECDEMYKRAEYRKSKKKSIE